MSIDPKKLEMIEEILEHLSGHQAKSLKDLLDKSKMPKEIPMEEGKEGHDAMPKEMGIEVDVMKPKEESFKEESEDPMKEKMDGMDKMDKPEMGGEAEMTDQELEELLKKIC